MKPECITIGVLNHNNDIFDKYVAKSLDTLKGNYELIIEQNKRPAEAYNSIIKRSKNKYIILLHADVSFNSNFISCVNKSIKKYPDFGAMGILGVKKPLFRKLQYIEANEQKMYEVSTLEPSCILINNRHDLIFDNINFDEYHLHVEDYCTQVRKIKKLNIYTMLINTFIAQSSSFDVKNICGDYFVHYNNTFSMQGARWGHWLKYKKILDNKWGEKVLTT